METQESVGQWARETFPGGDDMSPRHGLRLLEEVVELCFSMGASHHSIAEAVSRAVDSQSPRGYNDRLPESPEKVGREIADCDIVLDVIATKRQVDRQTVKDVKMQINRARRWRSNGDGTGYHIKE